MWRSLLVVDLQFVELYLVSGSQVRLLTPCALEMYSEASIVVTFPSGPRILAEFGMVAFAGCSATSFGVFHIFSECCWMQEFTFLTDHATRLFVVNILSSSARSFGVSSLFTV